MATSWPLFPSCFSCQSGDSPALHFCTLPPLRPLLLIAFPCVNLHQPSRTDQSDHFRPLVQHTFKTPETLVWGLVLGVLKSETSDLGSLQGGNGSKNSLLWSHREGWWQESQRLGGKSSAFTAHGNCPHLSTSRFTSGRMRQINVCDGAISTVTS
jgi:hypothetical protein